MQLPALRDAVEGRHGSYFTALAVQTSRPSPLASIVARQVREVTDSLEDLEVALRRACRRTDPHQAVPCALAIAKHHRGRGRPEKALRALETASTVPNWDEWKLHSRLGVARCRALVGLGAWQSAMDEASALLVGAIAHTDDYSYGCALVCWCEGQLTSDPDRARSDLRWVTCHAQVKGDHELGAHAHEGLAEWGRCHDDLAYAAKHLYAAIDCASRAGNGRRVAALSMTLAEVLILSGDPCLAQTYLSAGLEWFMDAGLFGLADRGIDLLATLLRSQQDGVLDPYQAQNERQGIQLGKQVHV